MKIRNCVNCGKTPKRDYQEEKKKAIDPGQWDRQSWRNHLAENQMEFRHPRANEFDRFSIKKVRFTVASQSIIYSKVINEKAANAIINIKYATITYIYNIFRHVL